MLKLAKQYNERVEEEEVSVHTYNLLFNDMTYKVRAFATRMSPTCSESSIAIAQYQPASISIICFGDTTGQNT